MAHATSNTVGAGSSNALAMILARQLSTPEQREIAVVGLSESSRGELAVILYDAEFAAVALGWVTPAGVRRERDIELADARLVGLLTEAEAEAKYGHLIVPAMLTYML